MYHFYIKQDKISGPFSACDLLKMALPGDTLFSEQSINGGQWGSLSEINLHTLCEEEREAEPESPAPLGIPDDTDKQAESLSEPNQERAGQTEIHDTPTCLNKWNWGAFSMPILWGLINGIGWPFFVGIGSVVLGYLFANKFNPDAAASWVRTLAIISYLIIGLILGNAGNRIAWRRKEEHTTIENFEKKQKIWNIVGMVLSCLSAIILIIYFVKINS